MTKIINRLSSKTKRRKGTLGRLLYSRNPSRLAPAELQKQIETLQVRIDSAPVGIVKTKKNRTKDVK